MILGGVDIGTSGCKCTIMTADGQTLASRYQAYAVSRTTGAHEVDAAVIWEAARAVIQGACADSGGEVEALCITSFGESCVLLDEAGRELAPILLYTDPRGGEECVRLNERLGERTIARLTGHRPNPMYFLPKLMWIRQNQPELYRRIHTILPVNAYVAFRLSGEAVCDVSLAACTMMLDVRRRGWCGPLLEAAGIRRDILPQVAEAGTAIGTVRPAIAAELGLPAHMRVVIGCHDQVAAAVGAGALRPGMAVNGSGTVECVTPVFSDIPDSPALFDGGFAVVPAPGGLYVTYAFIFTGGALLQWYRDNFAGEIRAKAKAEGTNAYALLDAAVRPAPSGLLTLPHFAGAATPYMDTAAKGAICGLSLENDAADVYRSLLEGVAYETRINLDRLEEAGIRVESLRATGGGARSAVWLQIKADILRRPIDTLAADEAGTVGSILLAGTAAGAYASLNEAMDTVKTRRRVEPAADGAYEGIYARYTRLYAALQDSMKG